MAEVRTLSGKKIDWNNPPKANAKCSWTKKTDSGKKIIGGFRTMCHLNHMNNLAVKKYDQELVIFQGPFNTSVAASAGTHDLDACWDLWIPGVGWWEQQKFVRTHGGGCWYRHAPLFSNHLHGITLPPNHGGPVYDDFKQAGIRVGKFVDGGVSTVGELKSSSQLVDYYNHAFGLSGQHKPNSDKSWFPKDIRATIFDLPAYVARRAA